MLSLSPSIVTSWRTYSSLLCVTVLWPANSLPSAADSSFEELFRAAPRHGLCGEELVGSGYHPEADSAARRDGDPNRFRGRDRYPRKKQVSPMTISAAGISQPSELRAPTGLEGAAHIRGPLSPQFLERSRVVQE